MTERMNISVGDRVRVRYGGRAGEIAEVGAITRHSNQYGSYERFRIVFDDGAADERGADSLERLSTPECDAATANSSEP